MPAAQLVYLALEVLIVLLNVPRAWDGHYFTIMIATVICFLTLEHAGYYFGARWAEVCRNAQDELEKKLARNRKYWDEYDHLTPDPLYRSGIEVWAPASVASGNGPNEPRYFGTVP